jgi:hypothetical protein
VDKRIEDAGWRHEVVDDLKQEYRLETTKK